MPENNPSFPHMRDTEHHHSSFTNRNLNYHQDSIKQEIHNIEGTLKDWFLTRRLRMERNIALKKSLDRYNFSGLAMNNENIPAHLKVLWHDIVLGKPELDEELSVDAKEMKADMYLKYFKNATDLENPCRIPGTTYFRCLQDHVESSSKERSNACLHSFGIFDSCRSAIRQQQASIIKSALTKQDMDDLHAKSLFERRNVLLDRITGLS